MKKSTGGRSRNVGDEEYSWGEVKGVVVDSSRRGGVSVRTVFELQARAAAAVDERL